jgi:putative membrane fusion protein
LKKKQGKKRKRQNKLYYFFFGIVILYFLVKLAPVALSTTIETEIAKYGSIQVNYPINGYIVRNEKLIKSESEGNIKYFVQDGEKVEKGYKVAEIYRDTIDSATRKKLEVINQRIESLNENKENLFDRDVNKLDQEIHIIIEEMKAYREKGELLKIEELKKELNSKVEKKRIIHGDKSFAGKNLDALKQEQQMLESKITSAITTMTSTETGVISYFIDGYEMILNPLNMGAVDYQELKKQKSQTTDLRAEKTILGQPIYKIVDNSQWYLIAWIDKENLSDFKAGKNVGLKFPQGTINGQIYKIIENDENGMIIFKIDEYVEDYHKIRNIDIEVTAVNHEGLKIYNDCIVEKDGIKGVYVLDVSRFARFKPIKIVGQQEEFAIVQSNVFYEKHGEDVKTVETIKLYDEIVRHGTRIKEGQLVYE